MVQSWGYPPESKDTVNMVVPTDMAEVVGALIADPDAFMASLRSNESALAGVLIEVESGTWVTPSRIVALAPSDPLGAPLGVDILLDTGGFVTVAGPVEDVLRTIGEKIDEAQAKLSEGRPSVSGSPEGAPPA